MTEANSGGSSDRLLICGLELRCVIGVEEWERLMPQRVVVNVEVKGCFAAVAESDDLADAVDYRSVCARVMEVAAKEEYRLLETLADRVARAVLGVNDCIEEVKVGVVKPLALGGFGRAEAVVEVTRGASAN